MDFKKVNRIAKVHHYKKKGFSNAKISRMLGIHRNTVRSDLEKRPDEAIAWVENLNTRSKKLDPFKETILNWLNDEPELSAAQVEDWLDEQFGYTEAAPSTIRSYVKELRETYGIPKVLTYRNYEAVPELPPGKQIQVDFGEITVKRGLTDSRVKLYCIGFVLNTKEQDIVKFIPASGAASRMFKDLYEYLETQNKTEFINQFITNLNKFPFYIDLKGSGRRTGPNNIN